MKQLFAILIVLAVGAGIGCQNRAPGTPKPTKSAEKEAERRLTKFNQTDINAYPSGRQAVSRAEAQSRLNFLREYVKNGEYILSYSARSKRPLDHKQTVESNIQTAKALITSYENRLGDFDPKGDQYENP